MRSTVPIPDLCHIFGRIFPFPSILWKHLQEGAKAAAVLAEARARRMALENFMVILINKSANIFRSKIVAFSTLLHLCSTNRETNVSRLRSVLSYHTYHFSKDVGLDHVRVVGCVVALIVARDIRGQLISQTGFVIH